MQEQSRFYLLLHAASAPDLLASFLACKSLISEWFSPLLFLLLLCSIRTFLAGNSITGIVRSSPRMGRSLREL